MDEKEHEFLTDFYSEYPARTLQHTARPILQRPSTRPKPIILQGDVTDEE